MKTKGSGCFSQTIKNTVSETKQKGICETNCGTDMLLFEELFQDLSRINSRISPCTNLSCSELIIHERKIPESVKRMSTVSLIKLLLPLLKLLDHKIQFHIICDQTEK